MLEARAEPVRRDADAFTSPLSFARRSLGDDRDHWRERARRAENALRGGEWDLRLYPFTLYETRILRILARHERCSIEMFMTALYSGHRDIEPSVKSVRTLVTRCRKKLPKRFRIDPIPCFGWAMHRREDLQVYLQALSVRPLNYDRSAALRSQSK